MEEKLSVYSLPLNERKHGINQTILVDRVSRLLTGKRKCYLLIEQSPCYLVVRILFEKTQKEIP